VSTYDARFTALFQHTMSQMQVMVPITLNIRDAYAKGGDKEQQFIQNLAMFLCTFLKEHGQLAEKTAPDAVLIGLQYLVLISEVEEVEIFKICLEYWNALSADLYR
jgi:exportin-1